MVFASQAVDSDSRFAALPVGAASAIFIPMESNIRISACTTVVLPVPGPPVRIITPWQSASKIAFFCPVA